MVTKPAHTTKTKKLLTGTHRTVIELRQMRLRELDAEFRRQARQLREYVRQARIKLQ